MTLILTIAAAVACIWCAERSVEHLKLAIAGLCFNAAVLLFVVADFERAILLSSILATAIFGASIVKYNHSGLKLTVTDLPLAFAGTVPFLVAQYPLAVLAVITGGAALILAAVAAVLYVPGPPVSLELQVLAFSIAFIGLVAAYMASWRGRFLPAHRGSAAMFFFDIHRLPSQPTFLAAVRQARPERHRQGAVAADAGRTGAHPRLPRHYRHPARINLRSAGVWAPG